MTALHVLTHRRHTHTHTPAASCAAAVNYILYCPKAGKRLSYDPRRAHTFLWQEKIMKVKYPIRKQTCAPIRAARLSQLRHQILSYGGTLDPYVMRHSTRVNGTRVLCMLLCYGILVVAAVMHSVSRAASASQKHRYL